MSARASASFIGLLFLLIYLFPLGQRPIVAPDESRYGSIAKEILHDHDWWALRLVGLRYYEKPPLGYWMTAASMALFGENAWALRLPAALAALVTALATGRVAARFCATPGVGGAAAAVQLTMLFPWVFGGVAILDGIFTACVTCCVAFFALAAAETRRRPRLLLLALCGVAAAAAFLTKGFLGLAFPAMIAGAWLLWQRRFRDLLTLPLVPVLAAAVAAAPLVFFIHQRNPGFWHNFFWVEHIRRFTTPDANQHPEPWWFFLPLVPLGALMWVLNIKRILRGFRTALFHHGGWPLCVAWIALPLLLVSASSGKLPSYILPIYPPIAIIVAISLMHDAGLNSWRVGWADRIGSGLLIVCAMISAAAMLLGHDWMRTGAIWIDDARPRFGALALALLAWAALDLWSHRERRPVNRVYRMAISPAPLLMTVGLLFPTALVERARTGVDAMAGAAQAIGCSDTIIAESSLATSIAYATRRFDMTLISPGGELEHEALPLEELGRFVSREETMRCVADAQKAGSVALVFSYGEFPGFNDLDAPRARFWHRDGNVTVLLFPRVD
jgi:4-amino-4-deoxy-L-arabinose transferase